jgi:hypothetical protein
MIYSWVDLLVFLAVIALVDGLNELYAGAAGGGQVSPWAAMWRATSPGSNCRSTAGNCFTPEARLV